MPRTTKSKDLAPQLNGGEAVARRAYEIFESRGAQHGYDLDHWLEAERELTASKPKKPKKTPQPGV